MKTTHLSALILILTLILTLTPGAARADDESRAELQRALEEALERDDQAQARLILQRMKAMNPRFSEEEIRSDAIAHTNRIHRLVDGLVESHKSGRPDRAERALTREVSSEDLATLRQIRERLVREKAAAASRAQQIRTARKLLVGTYKGLVRFPSTMSEMKTFWYRQPGWPWKLWNNNHFVNLNYMNGNEMAYPRDRDLAWARFEEAVETGDVAQVMRYSGAMEWYVYNEINYDHFVKNAINAFSIARSATVAEVALWTMLGIDSTADLRRFSSPEMASVASRGLMIPFALDAIAGGLDRDATARERTIASIDAQIRRLSGTR